MQNSKAGLRERSKQIQLILPSGLLSGLSFGRCEWIQMRLCPAVHHEGRLFALVRLF